MNPKLAVIEAFKEKYKTHPALIVHGPGRVNLIGEHTDYNEGFVMPVAIDKAIWIALRPSHSRTITIHSLDYAETGSFSLDAIEKKPVSWLEYIKGVAYIMQREGMNLCAWEGVASGDIPIGAGLSSSAALEMATARAFSAVSSIPWIPGRMARLCQRAENQWIGLNCGIMDQMISGVGVRGHAVRIDCRTLDITAFPLPQRVSLAVLDTATRRGLAGSAYNERRSQCEIAAKYFGVPALRDVSSVMLTERGAGLDPLVMKRARHIVTENERVLQACTAMQKSDAVTLGQLLQQGHISLRDDYEVSCPELDVMVDAALMQSGCYGARMTGAGFGGCAVAIVDTVQADIFARKTAEEYQRRTKIKPSIYLCSAEDGAGVEGG